MKINLFFHEITFKNEFPGSNFCYPHHFYQEVHGIFRQQIRYLLLLISNPAFTRLPKRGAVVEWLEQLGYGAESRRIA